MSLLLPLLISLPLCLLLITVGNPVYGVEEKTILSLKKFQWKQGSSGFSSCFSHKSRRENGATVLEMKHRDFCSETVGDRSEKLWKQLVSDDARVRSLQFRMRAMVSGQIQGVPQTQIPVVSGVELQTLNYVVTVELGGRNSTVIVDTGSDLTWVQCQPCKSCYNQQESLFNPTGSPTYQSVPCNSPACRSLQFATGFAGACGTGTGSPATCRYQVSYGDGSYTHGDLGRDRLVLGTTPVDNFAFGCGKENKGLFGGASGLMGFGRGDISVISQTSAMFAGVFSYCLPSTETGDSGSLTLGANSAVYKNSTPILFTRMVPNPQLSAYYFLNLTGISIGGFNLYSPRFSQGGFLIDSGTVITRLPPSIYRAAKTEFLNQFSGYPPAPPFSILDTCFNLSDYEEVNIPAIKMRFDGDAELDVDVNGVFYIAKTDASQVCLALASLSSEDEIAIIGNYQQRNTRVVYDTKDSKLGFAKESCSFV